MSLSKGHFDPAPLHCSAMARADFVEVFGGVYEHSPWVAESAWLRGLGAEHDSVAGLSGLFREIVEQAGPQRHRVLIRAHPDLAGKAAVRGELTADSTSEQAGAGIDQCSEREFEHFQNCNTAYKEKFGFPFIMAVKGSNRTAILTAFEHRLHNDRDAEFHRALEEIHRIAGFRLEQIAKATLSRRDSVAKSPSPASGRGLG